MDSSFLRCVGDAFGCKWSEQRQCDTDHWGQHCHHGANGYCDLHGRITHPNGDGHPSGGCVCTDAHTDTDADSYTHSNPNPDAYAETFNREENLEYHAEQHLDGDQR